MRRLRRLRDYEEKSRHCCERDQQSDERRNSPTVCRSIRTARTTTPSILARDVGIRFKGVEKTNVEEYCISEGWVRVTAGNAKDRYGNPLTIKVHGPVEPYFRDKSSS